MDFNDLSDTNLPSELSTDNEEAFTSSNENSNNSSADNGEAFSSSYKNCNDYVILKIEN